jgi:hypothetical protein
MNGAKRLTFLLGMLLLFPALLVAWPEPGRQVLRFDQPPKLGTSSQLLVRGENKSERDRVLVIRIDDRPGPGYADRVNVERVLPPGPFRLRIGIAALHTASGRMLELEKLQQIILFPGDGQAGLAIDPPQLTAAKPLPAGVIGWDLGPEGSAVWPGFQPLTEKSGLVSGTLLKAIDRGRRKQAAEALTSDGIRGMESLTLPLESGRWRITLWLRDPGEWEYLPHPLERTIKADGNIVHQRRRTPDQWIEEVYLASGKRELHPDDDSWTLFGERSGERIGFEVNVTDSGLQLTFSGHQPEAGFVAAVLAEPSTHDGALERVEADRAEWWRENWPVKPWPIPQPDAPCPPPASFKTAPDSQVRIACDLQWHPGHIKITAPSLNGLKLRTDLRWGQWRLRRTALSSTLLVSDNGYLRSDPLPETNDEPLPRRIELLVQVPRQTPAGTYEGELRLGHEAREKRIPITIEVLPVVLPAADRPIGVYLERPVHFDWFDDKGKVGRQAMQCDLAFLRSLGLTGVAPPLTTPTNDSEMQKLVKEIAIVSELGFLGPVTAYTPFKRLMAQSGLEAALSQLERTRQQLQDWNLMPPVWVTADEPSNPGNPTPVERIRRYARALTPDARLAGHLNHATDDRYRDAFDLVLINDGYGLSRERIDQLKQDGIEAWLYNLNDHMRLAAGFYLWHSGAGGYLQWHARMPTADPFDPTDGREDDAQFLYPMTEPCPITPDIDAGLLEIVEGIQDYRWLMWLQAKAESHPEARALLNEIRSTLPGDWLAAKTISYQQLTAWRTQMAELARGIAKR